MLFYGGLAAMAVTIVAVLAYGVAYVRHGDLGLVDQIRRESAATKKAFDALVVGRTPEGFHRKDMAEWCVAFQQANRASGITCPDPYTLPGYRQPP
jgi:hypothetical protein